jgi:hypothetical protein
MAIDGRAEAIRVTKVFMGLTVLPDSIVLLSLAGEGKPSEVVASPVL